MPKFCLAAIAALACSLAGDTVGCSLRNVRVSSAEVGFRCYAASGDAIQGITFDTCSVVGAAWGAYVDMSLSPNGLQQFNFRGCHFNSSYRGIELIKAPQCVIAHNLFYRTEHTFGAYVGVDLKNSSNATVVSNNVFENHQPTPPECIAILSGTAWNTITNNTSTDMWITVALNTSSSANTVIGNHGLASEVTPPQFAATLSGTLTGHLVPPGTNWA